MENVNYDKVLRALDKGVRCMCGALLDAKNLDMYEHSGGIMTPLHDTKQWVFVVCKVCDYQNSHVKIIRRAERQDNEADMQAEADTRRALWNDRQ